MKRALLFILGVGIFASTWYWSPKDPLSWEVSSFLDSYLILLCYFLGVIVIVAAIVLRPRKEIDLEAMERRRRIEEEREKQCAKEDITRKERLAKAKSIKDNILANITPLGFREIKEDIRSLDEDERVPIGAKVHEVIPVIRAIALAQGIEMSYLFVMYDMDIPTVNIELWFLDEVLTIGPQIPL